jgi:hypothetical protein
LETPLQKLALVFAGLLALPALTAAASPPPVPCGVNLVSFYFGGFSQSLSLGSFDLTLLAHDGVTCTLPDTPLITVAGPDGDIPIHVDGRGGALVLRPDSPLHTSLSFNLPDLPENAIRVSVLRLSMPDKSLRGTFFGTPGVRDINKNGVFATAWRTGIGLGEGEGTS